MRADIQALIEKQKSGIILTLEEIRIMMLYCLDLLKLFENLTDKSIEQLKVLVLK